jgi:hypothetical protein
VTFDDDRGVAGAGLAVVATLSKQLGTFKLANELIDLGGVPDHAIPGRKVLTLVHAMVAGADCIDDCDVLRSGATGRLLGHGVMAPSTLGTFLRAFTFGHVRQLDSLSGALLAPHTDACTSVNGGANRVALSQKAGRGRDEKEYGCREAPVRGGDDHRRRASCCELSVSAAWCRQPRTITSSE